MNNSHRLLLTKQIPLDNSMILVFEPLMLAATKIWNSCVWHSRDIAQRENRWPSETELKAKFKEFKVWKELHSQSAQAVVEEYFEAVSSYLKHKQEGNSDMNPPGFKPKTQPRTVTWKKQGFDIKGDILTLKLSRGQTPIEVTLPLGWEEVKFPDGSVKKGIPVEIKVKAVVRRQKIQKLILHITLDFGVVATYPTGAVSAYDYNTAMIARTATTGTQDLFICREILALVQYRNKILAEFQSRMSKLKKGSRRWRKLNNVKWRVLKRFDRRIKQMEHALTKQFAELDSTEGVAFTAVGNLTNLRQHCRTGMKNKKANQKINQMAYNRLQFEQRYKNLIRGIETESRPELGTSSLCSKCGVYSPSSRIYRGLWKCKHCGVVLHADLNGSAQFLTQVLFGDCRNRTLPFEIKQVRVWHWNKRFNKFKVVFSQVSPQGKSCGVVGTQVTVPTGRPSGDGSKGCSHQCNPLGGMHPTPGSSMPSGIERKSQSTPCKI